MMVKSLLAYRHNATPVKDFNAFTENTSKILPIIQKAVRNAAVCLLGVIKLASWKGREEESVRSLLEKTCFYSCGQDPCPVLTVLELTELRKTRKAGRRLPPRQGTR